MACMTMAISSQSLNFNVRNPNPNFTQLLIIMQKIKIKMKIYFQVRGFLCMGSNWVCLVAGKTEEVKKRKMEFLLRKLINFHFPFFYFHFLH